MSLSRQQLDLLASRVSLSMRNPVKVSVETTADPDLVSVRWNCGANLTHTYPVLVHELIPVVGLNRWAHERWFIQEALPSLSPDQRECLMLGFCQDCVDDLYDFPED